MASLAVTCATVLPISATFVAPAKKLSLQSARASSSRRAASRWVMSTAPTPLDDKIEKGIKEATEVCADPNQTEECAVAWDEVEELSAAKADQVLKNKQSSDPLEAFCEENPESDECRVYSD